MAMKVCIQCEVEKSELDFYPRPNKPGEYLGHCKKCHNKRITRARSRIKLERALENPEPTGREVVLNELALELLYLEFSRDPSKPLIHPVHIQGALAPVANGLEIRQGAVGPILTFQTPTERVKVSLSITPVKELAREVAQRGVNIVLEGLKAPPRQVKYRRLQIALDHLSRQRRSE